MVKKTIILLLLYFLQFYLNSLRGKAYFANSQEPEPEPLEKKQGPELEPLGKKNQEPDPLEKKVRSRSWSPGLMTPVLKTSRRLLL